jgi:hypothetical protein
MKIVAAFNRFDCELSEISYRGDFGAPFSRFYRSVSARFSPKFPSVRHRVTIRRMRAAGAKHRPDIKYISEI